METCETEDVTGVAGALLRGPTSALSLELREHATNAMPVIMPSPQTPRKRCREILAPWRLPRTGLPLWIALFICIRSRSGGEELRHFREFGSKAYLLNELWSIFA